MRYKCPAKQHNDGSSDNTLEANVFKISIRQSKSINVSTPPGHQMLYKQQQLNNRSVQVQLDIGVTSSSKIYLLEGRGKLQIKTSRGTQHYIGCL